MKKYGKLILLSLGVVAFLASCQCQTCKKDSELTYKICKDQGSESSYNNNINALQSQGYVCE